MTEIKNNTLNESYSLITADCGLKIGVYNMPGYNAVHAVFATNFGSVDREFSMDGKRYKLPAGVAHFLEHKMFENEECDAFERYAKTGASANAFTSFDKTCYIFTATENIDESLDILLDFVTKPYFTEQTVQKEMGIIGQEIKMYDDSANWRLLFGILDGLYVNHPIKEDIAGTVDSIARINAPMLYDVCKAASLLFRLCGSVRRFPGHFVNAFFFYLVNGFFKIRFGKAVAVGNGSKHGACVPDKLLAFGKVLGAAAGNTFGGLSCRRSFRRRQVLLFLSALCHVSLLSIIIIHNYYTAIILFFNDFSVNK